MWPFHHLLFCSSHLVYQKPNSVLPQISLLWRLHRFHCPLSQVGTVSFLVLRGLKAMEALWLWGLALLAMGRSVYAVGEPPAVESPLMVNLTLIYSATDKGAVCLDGSLPAFHLHRGHGSGMNSWVVNLEGGGWCNSRRSCVYLKTSRHGSSNYMENMLPFTGMLSDKPEENPDFYNWNRVKIRYCDGASFSGEGYDEIGNLYFRGQRIWSSALEELMLKGLNQAEQVLLSGCSAGGLSTMLRCDEFRKLFPSSTKVKCFADAGLFLNTIDIANVRAVRNFFDGVVSLQGVERNLPEYCTSQMDPKLCFFPQYLLDSIQTPLFLLNSAYDLWQIEESIAPQSADPGGQWMACKRSHANCSQAQLEVLQGFREEMVNAVARFTVWDKNGLFLNSCFAHCQSEHQNAWFAVDSPRLQGRAIAQAVGDWFFDHAAVKAIDCPYPCDGTCQHQN